MRSRERPSVPAGRRGGGVSRPFAPHTAGEGVCFGASFVPTPRLVLEGRCDASSRSRDCETEILQHETKTHGPPSSSSHFLSRAGPSPLSAWRLASGFPRASAWRATLSDTRGRERLTPLDPGRPVPFGGGGDRVALARDRRTGARENTHGYVRSRSRRPTCVSGRTSSEVGRGSEAKGVDRRGREPT